MAIANDQAKIHKAVQDLREGRLFRDPNPELYDAALAVLEAEDRAPQSVASAATTPSKMPPPTPEVATGAEEKKSLKDKLKDAIMEDAD